MENQYEKTIAAVATAMSDSGIGIVRISGAQAFEIADRIYRGKKEKKLSSQPSHTIHYGYVADQKELVDEVLVMLMRAPHTFTGEDTVEFNCHGGVYVVQRVLELLLQNGASAAEPGEFTKRAFLNGKMDLSQAESVGDMIAARNEYALKNSMRQMLGELGHRTKELRGRIIHEIAFIETALDDPEHISIEGYQEQLRETTQKIKKEINKLLKTWDNGRIIKEGIKTVILGKPNAGKSSFLNALTRRESAIVTDVEGTTRDVIREEINLQGITLQVMDTAGIRNTADAVEKIGVEKAKELAEEADLIIYIADASRLLNENDKEIAEICKEKNVLVLLNKTDLESRINEKDIKLLFTEHISIISISAQNRTGIEEVEEEIKKIFFRGELSFNNEVYLTNVRQKEALREAEEALSRVEESIHAGLAEDFYSIDLMEACDALGKITGETTGEDVIHEIFSKFCMGK
ncbi:tRNA uridine-5-carboxymethylaminomethyl(34) synthesis GTPase MnmE [Suipraeoptans intestinalis]|uniref:tRNA uridine-5-carboxymethylaminomethyl(34) synthesis GTPase MnmE n=1 Tax=Suipraeoptans intestinalis TaxID=2606628 RepID=UPI002A74B706|nr:tRNA uridine-5-carboxymethylaminomethyl(34) synthesis GTPase MnmE [Suipraeoptans intestinalis]MDY3121210.1 tRNA uridine-5-carboxymethylaminomethyl(34) synthesis GTPase MnmE [Suipraeoptans intestinalis]